MSQRHFFIAIPYEGDEFDHDDLCGLATWLSSEFRRAIHKPEPGEPDDGPNGPGKFEGRSLDDDITVYGKVSDMVTDEAEGAL